MTKIDVFNHVYPPKYLNYPGVRNQRIDRNTRELPHIVDFNSRISYMDKLDIDKEILSLASPSIDDLFMSLENSRVLTKASNDSILEVSREYSERFLAIGTVSLTDPEFAVEEAERCVKDLHLPGIQIISNAGGEPIDLEKFEPFYGTVEKLNVPLWIHPTFLREAYPWLSEHKTDIMVGWDFDTTLSLIRLASSGILQRHANLKVIIHHLGSLVPILAGRISHFLSNSKEGTSELEHLNALKSLYVDTAEGMWAPWLRLAVDFFGIDHIMFGTDYPWGNTPEIINSINNLDISEEERDKIYWKNAVRIIGLEK